MIKKNTSILLTLLMGAITPSLYATTSLAVDKEEEDRGTKREQNSPIPKSSGKQGGSSSREAPHEIIDDSDGLDDDTLILKPFTDAMNNMPQGTAAIMDELISASEDEQRSRNIFEGILTELSDIPFNENLQMGSSIFTKFIRALETGYLYYNGSYWKLHENMRHIDVRLSALQKFSALVHKFHREANALNLKTDALRKSKEEAFEQSRNEDYERIEQEEKALESNYTLFKNAHLELFCEPTETVPYHSLGLINKKQYSAAKRTGNQKDTISFLYLDRHEGMIPFNYKLTLLESLKGSMIQSGSLPKEDAVTHHQGSFVDPISGRLLNLDVTLDYKAEVEDLRIPITLHNLMDDNIHWSARPSGNTENAYTYSIHLKSKEEEEEAKLGQLTISLQ